MLNLSSVDLEPTSIENESIDYEMALYQTLINEGTYQKVQFFVRAAE
jgi:hypothetical protein